MWANLFKWIQQKWWKNLHNFELGTCQLFPWCWPPWSKLRILAPWVLPWIPPWPLPYHGFSHRSHTLWVPWVLPWIPPWPLPYHGFSHRSHKLWVPWVLPWNPQLFSLGNWFSGNIFYVLPHSGGSKREKYGDQKTGIVHTKICTKTSKAKQRG